MKKKNLLKEIIDDREDICCLYARVNEAQQEIRRAHDRQTHHVKDHRTNDILPQLQFNGLCNRVEALEKYQTQLNASDNIARICKRLNELEEDRKALFPHAHTPTYDKITALCDKVQGIDGRLVFQSQMQASHNGSIQELIADNLKLWGEIGNFTKVNDVARIASNRQAAEILHMKEQIKGLENRLSRAQDMIAEMHKDGFIQVKKGDSCNDSERLFKGEPLKGDSTTPANPPCENCKNKCTPSDYEPCNSCMDGEKWRPKKAPSKKV
jgi:chromosome segregation ATPase